MPARKQKINLLPACVQQQQRNRKNLKWMAAAQAAVFLCIACAIIMVNAANRRAWHEAEEALRASIMAQAAQQDFAAQEIMSRQQAEANFLGNHAPPAFDAAWLSAILAADTGNTTTITYDGQAIVLAGQTMDIEEIETHRRNLLDTDSFTDVQLGRITQHGNAFQYELRVVLR